MNYLKNYNKLCVSRRLMNRKKGDGVYYESHHIKPKWLGGGDDRNNLVLLTAREHYIAHYLLFKHYKDRSSSAAFHVMNVSCNMSYMDSKKYAEVREYQSLNLRGELNPSKRPEVRVRISKAVSGKNNGMHGRVGASNPFFGKTHSKEFLDKKRLLHGHRVTFRNVKYLSIRQASKETGVSRYKILREIGK